jgi:mRNA-degrading endonuclease RelE of RelBE toxin-antitoxin system
MDFRIADTFTDSLSKLMGQEQNAVKQTAFDLQMNPAHPSLQFHKVERARDPYFWSVRVNNNIRLIVHKTDASLLLCYVSHHDKAYDWAGRRKVETHPTTGAAQLVQVRETIQEIVIPQYVEAPEPSKPALFPHTPTETLLRCGVPEEWIDDVKAATEDTLLDIAEHLPNEAAEAVLDLAVGKQPTLAEPPPEETDPFEHPDAKRRFRVMHNAEELQQALDFPWEKWTVFLHPEQRHLVDRTYNGPARVAGSAGTGKTVVALHRAAHLARTYPDARVLLTTFSDILANALQAKLHRLISSEPRLAERIEVYSMNSIGQRLYTRQFGTPQIASAARIEELVQTVAEEHADSPFSPAFVLAEWYQVIDAWQLETWDAYKNVTRSGRRNRLPEPQRGLLWPIFEEVRRRLKDDGLTTESQMFNRLAAALGDFAQAPYDYIVVDEAQDVSVSQLRFLATLSRAETDRLFLAGDLGQRIFQPPFSWKSLGVDIRGRSRTLRINYRTSHQIRRQADLLLDPQIADVDGNVEDRSGTISVFNGPRPVIQICDSVEDEIHTVAEWLTERSQQGVLPHEVGVFVRSENELERAIFAVQAAGLDHRLIDLRMATTSGRVSITTMHLAKGLEFRAIVVMACDDEVIPLQERIESVSDSSDLEEVYDSERRLLYVACTRARDQLLVTATDPSSEFLDDLQSR